MLPINKKNVKIKNLIGLIDNPTYEDLLFEIVNFLNDEKKYDGEFKLKDVSLKTRVRMSSDLSNDLNELIKLGYIEKLKYSGYKVLKHLWEL
jgi:Mn-dependent DtxR family transcriptional regulator